MEDNADEVGDTVADNDSVDVIEDDSIVAVLDDSVVEDTVVNVSEGMYLMQVIFISLSISITRV